MALNVPFMGLYVACARLLPRFSPSLWRGCPVSAAEDAAHASSRMSADAGVTVGPDPAALRFDDRLADGEAHAAALRFRCEERVEDALGVARGQPGSCVFYRDLDVAVLTQLRVDGQHAACVLHGLEAIEHQVHEHLLQLDPIGHTARKIVTQIGADGYTLAFGFALEHPDHFFDDLIHGDQLTFGRGLFVHRSQA